MRYLHTWLMQHVPTGPNEYSRLDILDGLPRTVAVVPR
jgi:hypothetical protein